MPIEAIHNEARAYLEYYKLQKDDIRLKAAIVGGATLFGFSIAGIAVIVAALNEAGWRKVNGHLQACLLSNDAHLAQKELSTAKSWGTAF